MSPPKSTFFFRKNVGGTRHPSEKHEPTLDHSGGGVHGKGGGVYGKGGVHAHRYHANLRKH